jgi:Glycoside-hydrolase family GH114
MNHGPGTIVLCCLAATALCGCSESRGTSLTLGDATVWHPAPVTSWQIQLTGTVDTTPDVQMFDIDLFDVDASVVATLHHKGAKVICHTSAGRFED